MKAKVNVDAVRLAPLLVETHKKFVLDYHSRRKKVVEMLNVPLAGPGKTNAIGFIDEFHYDRDGTIALVDDFAKGFDGLL